MNREETKEAIKVMQAFVDGKEIESRAIDTQDWKICEHPQWDFWGNNYRIKKEPTYRPYANAEEFFADVLKHGGWIISGGNQYRQITGIGYGCYPDIVKMNSCNWMKFGELFEAVWADDGSPGGVKEE